LLTLPTQVVGHVLVHVLKDRRGARYLPARQGAEAFGFLLCADDFGFKFGADSSMFFF